MDDDVDKKGSTDAKLLLLLLSVSIGTVVVVVVEEEDNFSRFTNLSVSLVTVSFSRFLVGWGTDEG